jgi:predicted metal-binding membrane protein
VKLVFAAIAGAWALAIAAQATGSAHAVHHDALIEHGPALPVAIALFLVAWQAMTAAMMLPSSLPLVKMYAAHARRHDRPRASLAAFLAGYALVWSAFGALAFLGDLAVHRTVDAWPWLHAHEWLILVATFALAGGYQFSSLKDACLRSCRHPGAYLLKHYRPGPAGGLRLGAGHGAYCVGCCWALMLVMFAAGVASLVWMGALTALMVVEKTAPSGRRFVPVTGATFLAFAALTAAPALVT